jgi:hypothetical protein
MIMPQSPFGLFADMSRLAFEANFVIGLRMMKLAAGGQAANAEAQRMVLEKIATANQVAVDNAFALMSGKSLHSVGKHSVAKYRRVVKANHRRLSRKK